MTTLKRFGTLWAVASLLIINFSCSTLKHASGPVDDGIIAFVFLQANDVYEITPLQGGKVGGLARMATVRHELLTDNKNTLTVHAGDFLNPSLIGTLKYEGNRIKGRQMIEVMNAVGFDLTTFGNHEFDLDYEDLQMRLDESEFEWTSCNTFQTCGDQLYPFYRTINGRKKFVPETYTWEISDEDGTAIKVGIFGVTLPDNQKDFVHYTDFYNAAEKAVSDLSKTTDVVIGLTHLNIDQDLKLAKIIPSVPLLMGGHDHDNMKHVVGNTVVTKADANVKTVYIHRLTYNKNTGKVSLDSELKPINDAIAEDPHVASIVRKWSTILLDKVGEIIEEPNKIIYQADVPLDGRESSIRHKQTNLGTLVAQSMYNASSNVDASFVNSGSIRIDDQIHGSVTPIDFFRALPYGGKVINVTMTGSLLNQILNESDTKHGNGAYLQMYKISKSSIGTWTINGSPLDEEKNYNIAMNDFLLRGYDFKFLTAENEGILNILTPGDNDVTRDIRLCIIHHLSSN
jgi:2',3'-cyclic-nucleotide 2'-phosphodiesterase (5'-nucleotidase family)